MSTRNRAGICPPRRRRRPNGTRPVRRASGRRRPPNVFETELEQLRSEEDSGERKEKTPSLARVLRRRAAPVVLLTVCALYAGTLVAQRTTAPLYIFVVATLTLATKCYASPCAAKNHNHNGIVAVPIGLVPIRDSPRSTSRLAEPPDAELSSAGRERREYHPAAVNSLDRDPVAWKGKGKTEKSNPGGRFLNVSAEAVESGASDSGNETRVTDKLTTHVKLKNFQNQPRITIFTTKRPMPPVHAPDNSLNDSSVLVLVVSVVVLTIALGLVTCVLNRYRGATATNPQDAGQSPTTAPMLSVVSAGAAAGVGGMDRLRSRGTRELAAARDRQVRMHSVRTDLAINLPPRISMPDGEEHPYHARLHIRDPEQESEIYQKCIKPPPNRTVLESESPPPYRSSSAGLLSSSSSSSSSNSSSSSSSTSSSTDWPGGGGGGAAPLVVRCHPASSSAKPEKTDFLQRTVKRFTGGGRKATVPTPPPHSSSSVMPVVIVPARRPEPSAPSSSSSSGNCAASNRPKPGV